MGIIRGLEEVVTCIYGPAVTYAFPDPLVTTYRHSVTHLSLISILDGTALNWCQQEVLRARMSNTVLFGKVKDAELIVYNFRGQMQCRMGNKREGPIEMYPIDGRRTKDLENSCLEGVLCTGQEGAGDHNGERNPPSHHA